MTHELNSRPFLLATGLLPLAITVIMYVELERGVCEKCMFSKFISAFV